MINKKNKKKWKRKNHVFKEQKTNNMRKYYSNIECCKSVS